ncbi:hypothetical protein RJ639_046853 [Escallonia herrerae]|uniref:Uncharacterized protein n=1 Tax=Escallonia herrerae TaxID=1293975 RepID=A0AA89B348_9ASTE|nr:hypothetical protein RJ639_046853 [Escallonia herrerae]
MNSKISDVHEAATGESYRSRRPLPKRGQIKSRIAANAVHSLVSVISRASPQRHRSSGEAYSRENKAIRNY